MLAGSPAALRAYTRFRAELRHGALPLPTLERIALAVAEHYRSQPSLAIHTRTARQAGVGIDEVAAARDWESADPPRRRCCATCARCVEQRGHAPMHLHEEAREAGWSDEQLLEAIASSRSSRSRRWSTSPARSRSTAPSRTRASSKRRRLPRWHVRAAVGPPS